ncbi:MAG: hypothetical protein LBQ31_04990 [Bacteroidales bacterium]|jgi:antitoxin component YwqK of YwqJK toxin-antitoxin module|nr:hypothetical protein [Bacteroidales bacterium]
MFKKVFLVVTVLVLGVYVSSAQNILDKKGRKQGHWKTSDTSRVLNYEGTFKDDMPVGDFTYYDKRGRIKAEAFYFRGGYASFNTIFDDSGRIQMTGYYLDKQKDSVWKYYHNGKTVIKEEHYKKGLLDGMTLLFDYGGVLLESQQWFRGLRNGPWWSRQEKGFQSVTYHLNKSTGPYMALYPDSSLYITGQYEDGLKEGDWKFYLKSGSLYKIDEYLHNELLSRHIFLIIENEPYNGTLQEISMDTVVMVSRSRGGKAEVFTASSRRLLCKEKYENVCDIFDIDYFFNASSSAFVAYRYVVGFSEELLQLKIPTPYPVYLDKDGIETVKNMFNKDEVPK